MSELSAEGVGGEVVAEVGEKFVKDLTDGSAAASHGLGWDAEEEAFG